MSTIPDDELVTRELRMIRADVMTAIARNTRMRRRWKFGIAALVLVGVGGGATAGTLAVVRASQEDITYSVSCYESADLNSRIAGAGNAQATDARTGQLQPRQTADPIELCQLMWRGGLLGQTQPPDDPNTASFPVPDLAACTG